MYSTLHKFFKAPQWIVGAEFKTNLRQPSIFGNFRNAKWYAIDLAKKGYFGGDPISVLKKEFSVILDILEYEIFNMKYESALRELNKKEK